MLYHFTLALSDIDHGVYETLDFKIAMHPSETPPFLLTRIIAYALNYDPALEFTPGGLSDPDAPALRAMGDHGRARIWIEIGNPSARKLHKAGKSADRVIVYTYKNPDLLIEEIRSNDVHRAEEIKIVALDPKFLRSLEPHLEKKNRWTLLHQQGQLDISFNDMIFTTELIAAQR